MYRNHVGLLVCPACHMGLDLETASAGDQVEDGSLHCRRCAKAYPISKGVPRFVPLENEASSFGFQWLRHAQTQLDSRSGTQISEQRFFSETDWPRDMQGETILEIGSGSGRFTEQVVKTGATVVSVDYSVAVEANQSSNGHHRNLLVVQADVNALPVRPRSFDRVFCLGVLQHLPDPEEGFRNLLWPVKPAGHVVIDVYRRYGPAGLFMTKYWVRPLLRRRPPEQLYRAVDRHVRRMWRFTGWVNRMPRVGRAINWNLLVADYRGKLPLSENQQLEWAILDTFDMLSPRYDRPQRKRDMERWFREARLMDVRIEYGYTGIYGRGRMPPSAQDQPLG